MTINTKPLDPEATRSGILKTLADKWPSSIVARTEISVFTGGLLSEKYLANLDSAGKGPEGRVRIGRKICYPVSELIRWLESRSTFVPERYPVKQVARP